MKKLSILLLCLFSLGTVAWAGQLEVTGPAHRSADPRSFITVGFTVRNTGTSDLAVDFTVELPPFWQLLSLPEARTIAAGEELLVPITVQVPSGAAADGQHHIIFTARSEAEEVQAVVTVLVEKHRGAILTLGRTDLTVARGERLVLPFTLENTSNYSTAFWLRVRLPRGFAAQPVRLPRLEQGQRHHGAVVIQALETAVPGSTWLVLEVGEQDSTEVFERLRLPLVVLSSAGSTRLTPDLLSRLEIEGTWTEDGAFRWQGSFWGDSSWPGGGVHLDLQLYGPENAGRGLFSWKKHPWTLSLGHTDYAGNTLQQPVRDPGILFAVQQSEKTSSLFWSPDLASYFAYRKGGSSLTFLMEEEQKIWFYGRSEAAVEIGRLWAEIGLPVAWRVPSSELGIRLGGQGRRPTALWALDWLRAGPNTLGRYQDLWRLSFSGQSSPFLFSAYTRYNNVEDLPEVARLQEDYASVGLALPFGRTNVNLRWGYGRRQEEGLKVEETGWEITAYKYWSSSHLYYSHTQLPLSVPRDYLRFGFYKRPFSWWLAAVSREQLLEVKLGFMYRQLQRDWEFEWQGRRQDGQSIRLKLTQKLPALQKVHIEGKLHLPQDQPSTWEVTVGYGVNLRTPFPFLKTKGRLKGRVFLDENGDGIWQQGERAISGCGILLAGEYVQTDKDGSYEFGAMLPGEYPLFLREGDLPVGLLPTTVTSTFVRLEKGEETIFDWPLVQGARLSGTLKMEDAKARGVWLLLLQGEKVVSRAVTDAEGSFSFAYVLPGTYQIALASGQFQASHYLSETVVTLKAGEERELELAVLEEEKPLEVFRTPSPQVFEVP